MYRISPLILGLISSLAFSQPGPPRRGNPPPAAAAVAKAERVAPEDRCTVQGMVLNATTGEPLRKATVRLNRMMEAGRMQVTGIAVAATTDATGQFNLSNVEPGRYRISVERSGYLSQQYGARAGVQSGGTIVTLAKGQKLTDVSFKLIPQGVITGRVLDEDGDPVQNVSVQCLRQVYVRGRKQWVPVNGQATNDLGEYRMHSLAPGQYYIGATHRAAFRDMNGEPDGPDENYATTYYPGGVSVSSATPIQVAPGAELRGIDIRLQKIQSVRVSGRVVNGATGHPVQRTSVRVISRAGDVADPRQRSGRMVDQQGGFVVAGLIPGSYWLVADGAQDRVALHGKVAVDVGTTPIEDVTLPLLPLGELQGSIRVDGGTEAKLQGIRVQIEPRHMGMGIGAPNATTAEDGTFVIRSVVPEQFYVRVTNLPEDFYLKSLKYADADVPGTMLDLNQGTAGAKLVITVAPGAGRIEGSVQDSRQQPASATVVLIPEGGRREDPAYYRSTATDESGQFSLAGIVPGDYRLFAFAEMEPGAHMDPEFMKPFERNGERVTIRQAARENIQLKLIEPR